MCFEGLLAVGGYSEGVRLETQTGGAGRGRGGGRGLTGHGHAAAADAVLVLAQLTVQLGLGDGGGGRGQVRVTQLPEEERWGEHKLLLRGGEGGEQEALAKWVRITH